MIESKQNLWYYYQILGHVIGISTNGFVKNSGEAVMGRGCAYEARNRIPDIALDLGQYILKNGNRPGYLEGSNLFNQYRIMILPVKHNWFEKADIDLVMISTSWLIVEAMDNPAFEYHVPRLGCGNGKLDWEKDVKEHMRWLPNNVVVHSYGKE